MANPTTNYGFVLPTATDLVTDLPADFDVALQGVDTRLKALQPGTTLGDLAYSSATANTNTRLGVGTNGQVLTVASGVPSWATAAAPSGPAFSVYRSPTDQSVTANTATKVQFNNELFDTDNCFDSSTNYRFTPTLAGKYLISFNMYWNGNGYIMIYKNGSEINRLNYVKANEMGGGSALISMNGSTDYIEFYGYTAGSTFNGGGGQPYTFAMGTWIRS